MERLKFFVTGKRELDCSRTRNTNGREKHEKAQKRGLPFRAFLCFLRLSLFANAGSRSGLQIDSG
jgi:hypothetical protein